MRVRLEQSDSWRPIELDVLFRQQFLEHIAHDIHVNYCNSLLLNVCNSVSSMLN